MAEFNTGNGAGVRADMSSAPRHVSRERALPVAASSHRCRLLEVANLLFMLFCWNNARENRKNLAVFLVQTYFGSREANCANWDKVI